MATHYLIDSVAIEPLVNNWYAWPFLISPATAAMVQNHLHLRILESFLASPELHRSAAKNPAMRGGPFMDYDGDLDRVQDLIRGIKKERSNLHELAKSIVGFNQQVQNEAKGYDVSTLYPAVPDALKGYVEIGYDLNHLPSLRFFEALLYASPYYDDSAQSVALTVNRHDDRAFVLSTPRFSGPEEYHLRLPFASPLIDALAKSRLDGIDSKVLDELIEKHLSDGDAEGFRALFAGSPPAPAPDSNYRGDGVRVRYFGHATVMFETGKVSIITDPVISHPVAEGMPRLTYADLPDRIDYVLLTHCHQDHVMFETLLQLRHRIGAIVVPRDSGGALQDPSLRLMLEKLGFERVIELSEMQSFDVPEGAVTGLPFLGEHADLHIRTKLAFHVRLRGRTFICAADSNNLQDEIYKHIHAAMGDVDHVFIGMECDGAPMSWLYGPLFGRPVDRRIDQSRRLKGSDADKAMAIVNRFNPKSVHVYAMGQEPWLSYISSIAYTEKSPPIVESDKVLAACRERNLASERLYGHKVWEV